MSKKIITIIIIALVLIIAGGVAYYFLTRKTEGPVEEETVVWDSGVSFSPNMEFDYPLYAGARFVFDYFRPPLLARYYIVPAKEGEIAQFYKRELEGFEITQDILVGGGLHFIMSNSEMMKYGEEDRTSTEAVERFDEGGLMTVEVGRAPQPFWDYVAFNTRKPGVTDETMVVFWFFHSKEI